MTPASGRWVVVVLASSLVLFLGVTMRTRIQDADGIALTLYGFPFAWRRASLATSCADCVSPLALAFDTTSALVLVSLAAYPFRDRATRWLAPRSWPLELACIVTMLSFAWLAFLSTFAMREPGLGDGWSVVGRDVVWGADAWAD